MPEWIFEFNILILYVGPFFALLLMYLSYKCIEPGLVILENTAKEKYNKEIKYDRMFAFLFGVFYLNYAINTYNERLSNNLKIEKLLSKIKSFQLWIIPFILSDIFLVLLILVVFAYAFIKMVI